MPFTSIQPLALRLREDAQPVTRDCITLAFPEHWADGFRKLQAQVSNRPTDKVTVPIWSLNRTLRAVVPPIISIEPGAAYQRAIREGKPWLYRQSDIKPAILISVVHAWAQEAFKDAPDEMVHQVLTTVQTHDVNWKIEPLDLVHWETTDAGTALNTSPGQFILFPDYVAATLSSVQEGFQYGDHPLHFRRSSLAPGQKGAELTSWPPLGYGDARYSVVLTFTLQTVPFQPHPVLHCDVSIRRWAGPRRVFFTKHASAYISANLPFIAEFDGWSNQLQVVSLKRERRDGEWTSQWEDRLVDTLARLRSKVTLIDADQLTRDPATGQDDWDNAAAIVYSTKMKRHAVGAGITIRERGQLFDQITGLLDALFEPVAPFARIRVPKRSTFTLQSHAFFEKIQGDTKKSLNAEQREHIQAANEQVWSQRRALVCETVGTQLCIEIRAVTESVRENLVLALQAILGIHVTNGIDETFSTPEMQITVSFDTLGSLTDNLDLGAGKRVEDRVRDATQRRVRDVVRQFPKPGMPTLTLAEILPKNEYPKNCDPKSALRIGLGRSGRLTQFITAGNKNTEESIDETEEGDAPAPLYYRASNAVLDGLRQLGVPGKLPVPTHSGRPCILIGVWLINKRASQPGRKGYKLPVLVRISSTDNIILAMVPGFDDWLPYREAMLKLSTTDVFGNQNSRADYAAFIHTQLRRILSPANDTLLICHAQNLRRTWPWLSNTNITRDTVTFGFNETPISVAELRGLRIVRVRDVQGHETPEWFAEEDGRRSASQGLFQMGERVFASTHAKPKQFQKYSHYASKAEGWISSKKPEQVRLPQPSLSTWNPGLYELTVAVLQPEDNDDPAPWANLVHELRRSSLHFEDATALPLPLHLAKLMEEYILSVDMEEEEEDL